MSKFMLFFSIFFTLSASIYSEAQNTKPRIAILATGGTIAGVATVANNPNSYNPGQLMIDTILQAIPELNQQADVVGEQLRDPAISDASKSYINVGSSLITEYHRILLARRVNELLRTPEINGVIVTHGTDTIEETAFFLSLTVASHKPVILVGAVRPANYKNPQTPDEKADGPQNILDAVHVITDVQSQNRGVMLVMAGKIHSALDVVKTRMVKPIEDVNRITPFSSPNFGVLGEITNHQVQWSEDNKALDLSAKKLNAQLLIHLQTLKKFDIRSIHSLPLVPVLYGSAGNPQFFIDAIKNQPQVKAVVVVGTGEGSLDPRTYDFLQEYQCIDTRNAVVSGCKPHALQFVRSSRAQAGYLREFGYYTRTVGSGTLSPTKAQILTQLIFATWPADLEVNYENFRKAFVPYLVEGKR